MPPDERPESSPRAEPLATAEEQTAGASLGGPDPQHGGGPVRVRFAHGIAAVPGDSAAVVLPDDAILRWRPTSKRPAGAAMRLDAVATGAGVAIDGGEAWDEGIVLGRVVRPARGGFWKVDGDLAEYRSAAEAEQEHGPLEIGGPASPAPPAGGEEIALDEPLAREEIARALGCEREEVETELGRLRPAERSRALSRAARARSGR